MRSGVSAAAKDLRAKIFAELRSEQLHSCSARAWGSKVRVRSQKNPRCSNRWGSLFLLHCLVTGGWPGQYARWRLSCALEYVGGPIGSRSPAASNTDSVDYGFVRSGCGRFLACSWLRHSRRAHNPPVLPQAGVHRPPGVSLFRRSTGISRLPMKTSPGVVFLLPYMVEPFG